MRAEKMQCKKVRDSQTVKRVCFLFVLSNAFAFSFAALYVTRLSHCETRLFSLTPCFDSAQYIDVLTSLTTRASSAMCATKQQRRREASVLTKTARHFIHWDDRGVLVWCDASGRSFFLLQIYEIETDHCVDSNSSPKHRC